MLIKNIFRFTLIFVALLPVQTFAEGYAGYAGAFLRMGSGAVALGNGDAGVAASYGATQAFYNPAGLPYSQSNDVYAGYHVLSLDRQLAHVSALFQIKQVAFWSEPIIPLRGRKDSPQAKYPTLIYPDALRLSGDIELRVRDYMNSLIHFIYTYYREHENQNLNQIEIPETILLDNQMFNVGVLAPVLEIGLKLCVETSPENKDDVRRLLADRYMKIQEKPAAIAINWTHAGTDDIEGRDFDGIKYGTLGYYDNRFSMSFGLRLRKNISLGISLGVLYSLFSDVLEDGSKALTSTTFGADAGIQFRPFMDNSSIPYRLNSLVLGAAVYDMGSKNSWNTTDYWSQGTTKTDYYPDRYRIGLAYSPHAILQTYLDLETDLDKLLRPKAGVEVTLIQRTDSSFSGSGLLSSSNAGIVLRGGVDNTRPTFGIGIDFRLKSFGVTRFDYAYVVENVSPEATQIISWKFYY